MKKIQMFLILVFVSTVFMSINVNSAFVLKKTDNNINAYKNSNLLRLHVVANSNNPHDQYIKRFVRDKVINYMEKFAIENNIEADDFNNELKNITIYTEKILQENKIDYKVKTELGFYHFPDRTYEDITLPEGKYKALKIVLGNGQGSNWWCVLLPPMCIENEEKEEGRKIEFKFKLLELFNRYKAKENQTKEIKYSNEEKSSLHNARIIGLKEKITINNNYVNGMVFLSDNMNFLENDKEITGFFDNIKRGQDMNGKYELMKSDIELKGIAE